MSTMRAPVAVAVLLLLAGPVLAASDGYYDSGHEYLPVQDDSELGEILLFDIIAQGVGASIRDVLEVHNDYDLYPEEVGMVFYLARESSEDYDKVAERRADERDSWKELARRYDVDPDRLGQPSTWYRMGDRDEWWREDPDVEREVMTDMLAGAFGVDRRVIWDWATDGLGYGDAALALEFERRSGQSANEIVRLKMDRKQRWDEVADGLGISIDDLYAKRSLHYHDREFKSYLRDDNRDYHPRRSYREHRSRREYHYYDAWERPRGSYFRYAYAVDYDPYFSFGRAPYAYWYPSDWDYASVYPSWHWTSSIFHPIPHPMPIYMPSHRPVRPPCSPTAPRFPVERDTRRYAVQLLDTGSRSVAIPGGGSSRRVGSSGRAPSERSGYAPRSSSYDPPAEDSARQSARDRQRDAERPERSGTRKGNGSSDRSTAPTRGRSSSGSYESSTPRGGVSRGSASPPPTRGGSSARRPEPPKSSGTASGERRSSPAKPREEHSSPPPAARPSSPPRSSPPASPPSSPSGRSGSRKGGR